MKNTMQLSHTLRWLLLAGAMFCSAGAGAVVLDDDNVVTVPLDDGRTTVTLYGEAPPPGGAKTHKFYYMPVNLHLSQLPDKTPEFLFLKFTSEKRTDQGGLSGALMHFLMEWGLSPDQEAEVTSKLKKIYKDAQLMGAAPMDPPPGAEAGSFQIISATMSDKTLTPSVVQSGTAPMVPGDKVAAASRLTADGAQLMAATFEKARSITDLSISLNFGYQTLTPAAKGTLTIDYSRIQKESNSLAAEYKRTQTGTESSLGCFIVCWGSVNETYSYSYNEIANQWKFLEQKQIVKFNWDETISDERVAKVREAFLQVFINAMTQPAQQDAPPPAKDNSDNKDNKPDIRTGDRYSYKVSSFKQAIERKTQVYNLTMRLAVRHPFNLTGNLAEWYNGVRDNPKCVSTINLNDAFFQHRDINFLLDGDAKDIFDEVINYVTVNVRKTRSSGRPFEDRVTMDAKYVKEKGVNATVTYARGEDDNADLYEYQTQWSLKGGKVWPENSPWQKGSWEGVTLAPPVVPRTIDVEGDLDAMKSSGITRVTVQVHYPRLGQEMEENIQLSPAQGQALVSKKIFNDRDAKGYVYRLVVNHKTEGKLALPWSAQVGDNYIYATIPANLLVEDSVKQAAKDAAKAIGTGATEKVLDRFKDVIGGSQQ